MPHRERLAAEYGFYGVSVFLALDLPVDELCASTDYLRRYSQIQESTAGRLSSGFLCPGNPVSRLRFVEAEKAEQHNVAKACELLEVSRCAFYDWHLHRPSARALADEQLGERIEAIFEASRGTYGWPRVHRALRNEECTPAASGWPGSCARRA